MGKYTELYHNMKSAHVDANYINHIIDEYINKKPLSYHDFYASLLNYYHHTQDQKNEQEENRLYQDIFSKWKKQILLLSQEKLQCPKDLDYNKHDLLQLHSELQQISSYEEMKKNSFVSNYFFDKILGITTSKWCHLESKKINVSSTISNPISHRFYLNCLNSDIHFIIRRLIEKLEECQLPYNLKFDTSGAIRDDKIIIYTDTFHIFQYITVLKSFERDYPKIMERSFKPPILVGAIDQWIGFGDEPEYEAESYNDLRTKLFYDVITDTTLKRMLEDKEVLRDVAYYFIEVKKIVPIQQNKLETYRNLISKICIEIGNYLNNHNYQSQALVEILKVVPHFIKYYMNNNQYYFQDIKEQLENKLEQYHISKSKICFNSDNLEKFKLYDQPHVIQDIDIIKTLDINIKPDFYVIGDDIYQSIENILYYNFIRLVRSDGTVLKKDGTKITAKEFLENIAKQYFIKNKVIYSDIYKNEVCGNRNMLYLQDLGQMTPWEFTEFLGNTLLSKTIMFQNHIKKSVRECMNELRTYLPESGIIYTKYNRRMKLLEFLKESFENEQCFLEYQDIVEWFYYQTSNHPGVFSTSLEERKDDHELFSKIKIETIIF